MFEDFQKRTCLVSGGLGLIGSALSIYLEKLGAKVFVLDKGSRPQILSPTIEYIQVDLAKLEELDIILKNLVNEVGFDHLFNCASSKDFAQSGFYNAFEDYDFEIWQKILDINTTSTAILCSVIGTEMVKRRFGTIVNFGSIYGSSMASDQRIYNSLPENEKFNTPAVYSVSKGGVVALSKHLACLWGKNNVRTNVISPGGVKNMQHVNFISAYASRVPMNRMADVHEIVLPAIFLASDSASYINGHELFVDGGLNSW
jgi:NAD(P)-dependent dehydrogenase (short-subunit alcohol dehydrogenase family)